MSELSMGDQKNGGSRARLIRCALCVLIVGGVSVASYLFGAFSYGRGVWPMANLLALKQQTIGGDPPAAGAEFDQFKRLARFGGKKEIPCPEQTAKTLVILAIGQSNAGNSGGQRYSGQGNVLNYFEGKCYLASSPLLGSAGTNGEAWTLLGNKLVEQRRADAVILVPMGIGGSPIRRWKDGGDLNEMLQATLSKLALRYRINLVLWHQGEADFVDGTSGPDYAASFLSLVASIRKKGVDAPVYVSVATKCELVRKPWTLENPIANEQKSLQDPARRIFQGVNTDALLDRFDRYDGCHFGQTGQEKFADAWLQVLSLH